jgi:hypothetical protein
VTAPRPRRWGLAAGVAAAAAVLAIVVVLGLVVAAGRDNGTGRGSGPAFGTLASSCTPDRVPALRQAGVSVAMIDVQWAAAEPQPGGPDLGYLADVRQRIATCTGAGMRVLLGLGLDNGPAWLLGEPGVAFVDQDGTTSPSQEPDLVFSAAARDAAGAYLHDLATVVGLRDVAAIRLSTELGYPGPVDAGTPTRFWAYGEPAQGGAGLAEGVEASPMPGWRPADPTWQDAPVTPDQVDGWYSWYTRSLAGSVVWVSDTLRGDGFTGDVHVPVAGRGVLAQDRAEAVAGGLDGRGDPDGNLGYGLDYPSLFGEFAALDARLRAASPPARLAIDYTGLDDDTATRTRAASPGEETCHPGDTPETLARAGLDRGAGQRWTLALARSHGLPLVAENPGPPGPTTGGSPYSDSVAVQMARAGGYARDCGLEVFLLAFEDQLFEPGSGIDVPAYGRVIARSGP